MTLEERKASARKQAYERLAHDYQGFAIEELRWDWCCNIRDETRELIRQELKRRNIDMEAFDRLGRGRRRL